MILIRVESSGLVKIAAKGHASAEALLALPFVDRKPLSPMAAVGSCLWTYIPDLRRALGPGRFQFEAGSGGVLKRLMDRTTMRARGDDRRVLALFRKPPHPYQLQGIHSAYNGERTLLADDVGLGKTIQSIGVILLGLARGTIKRALIICPSSVKHQWHGEIHDFAAEAPNVAVVSADAGPRWRATFWRSGWQVAIVNPELVLKDAKVLHSIGRTIDAVVLDEASNIRNPEALLSRTIKVLFARVRYKIALTATPVENRLADLRSVFEFVDRRIFPSVDYFNKRYVVWKARTFFIKNKRGRRIRVQKIEPAQYKHLDEVRFKIRPFYLRRRAKDVGQQLPELVVRWEEVTLSKAQRAVYDSCKADAAKRVDGLRGMALYAPLVALRQACNATALVVEGAKPVSAKLDRLRELLATELAGEQVIIFTEFERWIRRLERELAEFRPACFTGAPEDVKRRRAEVEAFKAGHRQLLLATKAGERGLNLQVAGVVVNLDLPFNPASLKQRIGRARRLNSGHESVRVLNFIAKDTIEDKLIRRAVYEKRGVFEGIFGEDELTIADPIGGMTGATMRKFL